MSQKSFRIHISIAGILAIFLMLFVANSHSSHFDPTEISVEPAFATQSTKADADDPAIWINARHPEKSVIIGTDKGRKMGGLYVWDMHGRQLQYIKLRRPNNVDVRNGFKLGNRTVDIAVTNLRHTDNLKVYAIDPESGTLTDVTSEQGIQTPEVEKPYGLCLYKRPADGAIFVIESSKLGDSATRLHQYQLVDDGRGRVAARYVRSFGQNTIRNQVEGLVADDELGYVYASDEDFAVRQYYADPDLGNDGQITAFATRDGIQGDREGLAIYKSSATTGYILVSSQGNSTVKIYRREGDYGNGMQHRLIATLNTLGSFETDGIEVTSQPIPGRFPMGFLVKHNSPGRQFMVYSWANIAAKLKRLEAGRQPEPHTPNPLKFSHLNSKIGALK